MSLISSNSLDRKYKPTENLGLQNRGPQIRWLLSDNSAQGRLMQPRDVLNPRRTKDEKNTNTFHMRIIGSYCCLAQEKQDNPKPELANEKYGTNVRNVLDLWKAKSDKPSPLVIFIHGGGFRMGSKDQIPAPLIQKCLEAGISIASIGYRLTDVAPIRPRCRMAPAPYSTSASRRRNSTSIRNGSLQPAGRGGGVSRCGSRSTTILRTKRRKIRAQAVDAHHLRIGNAGAVLLRPALNSEEIGGKAHEHPALQQLFRVKPDELESDKAAKLFEDASPLNHLTKDDPPSWLPTLAGTNQATRLGLASTARRSARPQGRDGEDRSSVRTLCRARWTRGSGEVLREVFKPKG